MECEESEQLKEISRLHLETPSHALRSLRKDGDYGEKTTSFPRTEAQNLRGRRFRISEDGSLEPPRTEVQNLRGRRFRISEDGDLEPPRTEALNLRGPRFRGMESQNLRGSMMWNQRFQPPRLEVQTSQSMSWEPSISHA